MILGGYHAYVSMTMEFGYRDCIGDAVAQDGRQLVFPLWTVTRVDGPDRYAISKVVKDVPVEGSTAEIRPGATVSIVGTFRASDAVVVEEIREIHVLRRYKEILGVVGFFLAAAAAPFAFAWRDGRLVERRNG